MEGLQLLGPYIWGVDTDDTIKVQTPPKRPTPLIGIGLFIYLGTNNTMRKTTAIAVASDGDDHMSRLRIKKNADGYLLEHGAQTKAGFVPLAKITVTPSTEGEKREAFHEAIPILLDKSREKRAKILKL